jgi:poly(A) polymerase
VAGAEGDEARIVGGAPRDALLGRPVSEIDFSTTAVPGVVQARAQAAGLRSLPTGLDHGTVTLLVDGAQFEVTTLREDVATDGRRAVVRFGRSFERDAWRRDFTVNALFVSQDGAVSDFVGGLQDLALRRIRFIGDARARITEDYLRILRFLRFHAQFGRGDPSADARDAIIACRAGLALLSRERVRSELLKLLAAPGAAEAAQLTCDLGLLPFLIAGVGNPARLARRMRIEVAAGQAPDAIARLGAFALLVCEDADRLQERLRLSNAQGDRLRAAARLLERLHGADGPPSQEALRGHLFLRGRQACLDGVSLAFADSGSDAAGWPDALRFISDEPIPTSPFGGEDLIERGLAPGPSLGRVLKQLQADWIRAGFPRDARAIAALLDQAAERAQRGQTEP